MLWLKFCLSIVTLDIEKVLVEEEVITFWESAGDFCYPKHPFPHTLFKDEKVKEAVLDTGACGDATFNMKRFVFNILYSKFACSSLLLSLRRKVLTGRARRM